MSNPTTFTYPCPNCRRLLASAVTVAGRTTRCPVCDEQFQVPDPAAARATDRIAVAALTREALPPE